MTAHEKTVLLKRLERAFEKKEENLKAKEPLPIVLHDLVQDLVIIKKMIQDNNFNLLTFD